MTITQIELFVLDLARAIEFYREILQLPLLVQTNSSALLESGAVHLMLSRANDSAAGGSVYFEVGDIELRCEELKSRGVKFERDPHLVALMPDHELRIASFRDPDGNKLALTCRKSLPQPPQPLLPSHP